MLSLPNWPASQMLSEAFELPARNKTSSLKIQTAPFIMREDTSL